MHIAPWQHQRQKKQVGAEKQSYTGTKNFTEERLTCKRFWNPVVLLWVNLWVLQLKEEQKQMKKQEDWTETKAETWEANSDNW